MVSCRCKRISRLMFASELREAAMTLDGLKRILELAMFGATTGIVKKIKQKKNWTDDGLFETMRCVGNSSSERLAKRRQVLDHWLKNHSGIS